MNDLELISTEELVNELKERFDKVVVVCESPDSTGEGEQPPPLGVRFVMKDAEEVLAVAMLWKRAREAAEGKEGGEIEAEDIENARRALIAELLVAACRSVLNPKNEMEKPDGEE